MDDIKVLLIRLMDAHGDYLKKTAYIMVNDQQLAEDLVQETFFSFYRSKNRFRNESSYKTYLYSILMNQVKMNRRKKIPLVAFDPISTDYGFVTFEEQTIQVMDLNNAVRSLKYKYAVVIVLYYFNDLKIKEISELLGITQSSVKMRLKRAKEQLFKKLKGGNQHEAMEKFNG